MGPSFKEIPDFDSEAIIRTWKICLLNGKRTYHCKRCEEKFKSISDFYQHFYRSHIDRNLIKVHTCYICDKTYNDSYKLRRHMLGHDTSQLQYEVIYASPTDLTKQYWCKKCQNTFTELHVFSQHFIESHSDDDGKAESNRISNTIDRDKPYLGQEELVNETETEHESFENTLNVSNINLIKTDVFTVANIRQNVSKDSSIKPMLEPEH